jgi:hypothetical protein
MNEKRLLQDGERSCHQFWVTHGTEPEPATKEKVDIRSEPASSKPERH